MKKHNIKALALTLPLVGSALASPAVFADEFYNYGIDYTGGAAVMGSSKLSDIVNAEGSGGATLANSLSKIITTRGTTSFSGSWLNGYYATTNAGEDVCLPTKYILVSNTEGAPSGLSFTTTNKDSGYSLKVSIESTSTVLDITKVSRVPIAVVEGSSAIHVGEVIYTDSACTTRVKDADNAPNRDAKMGIGDGNVFVEMSAKLYKGEKQFVADGLYFGIEDIDAAQSYRILSTDSMFDAAKMISPDPSAIDSGSTAELTNQFYPTGHYIYSMYTTSGDFIQNDTSHRLLSPVTKTTMQNGLDFVFGFAKGAGSGILFYAQQFKVTYTSDDKGEISGIKEENIIKSDTPNGSTTEPSEGYELSYWTANKNVVLDDGTEIAAGEPITEEQIAHIVVTEDITLTAVHEKAVAVPDTGEIVSKELSGAVVPMSIAGIIALATILFYLPRINHKKVNFKKK